MKSLKTLTQIFTGIKKSSLRLSRGDKERGKYMKDNKITRKKYRLEVLEKVIDTIYDAIEEYENSLKYSKEQLAQELDNLDNPEEEQNNWCINRYRNGIDEYSVKIEEAKKLITDIEKMV